MTKTKHTTTIERALDDLDPSTTPAENIANGPTFRRLLVAREAVEAAQDEVVAAVAAARVAGDSWTMIGAAPRHDATGCLAALRSAGPTVWRLAKRQRRPLATGRLQPALTFPPSRDGVEEPPAVVALDHGRTLVAAPKTSTLPAIDWLQQRLMWGPEPRALVIAEGTSAGYGIRTLDRVAARLGVVPIEDGVPGRGKGKPPRRGVLWSPPE